ncbi:MAG: hypothetical protein JW863_20195 [Chitinispirillaceae bacterium]|nr:hypothetical protein [Chitinispirillaceae bacterium]
MTKFGIILICIGFIAGTLATVIDVETVRWVPFITALFTGILGIVLTKASMKKETRSAEVLAVNMQHVETSIARIIMNLKELNEKRGAINTYDVRRKVDELFLEDLTTFVKARESISLTYGLQTYADVMSHFAAGDRYLNRVWCASADGYIDEVNECLDKSLEQFEDSQKKLISCKAYLFEKVVRKRPL